MGNRRRTRLMARLAPPRLLAVCVCALGCCALAALAQPVPPPTPPAPSGKPPTRPTRELSIEEAIAERARLEKDWLAAFEASDYSRAEALLRELVPLDHDNFVPWYNLACVLSLQGKLDEAMRMLQQAIARGYSDRRTLETDPHLANLRGTEGYADLLAGWDRVLAARASRRLDRLKQRYAIGVAGSPYVLSEDKPLNLVYVSAFDPKLFEESRAEITRLAAWWERYVSPPTPTIPSKLPADGTPVVVLLPTRSDFLDWAVQRYGAGAERVGGAYLHDEKQLIAMDLGATLRHEFWHVLHWRDMDRLGQRHPFWVMEGLCSLVEDVEVGRGGVVEGGPGEGDAMIAKPSWRTNIVRRLAKAGNLTPWDTLFGLDQKRFMTVRPLAMYAQSRAVFMFIHEHGRLRDWYAAYTANFAEDPSGMAALATAFGKPARQVEREFRAWARQIPEVAEVVGEGAANLPVEVGPGSGDGPEVLDNRLADFLAGRAGASRQSGDGGLRPKDVITAIDGKPVRDLNDLARVLGEFEAGESVTVGYRRGKTHAETTVRLVPPLR